jgi:DNA helicase-2/ATP-dependent DNA helicase PcrA
MEVRDIIAYLKLAMNPHDSIALQRVINTPTRGIGKMTLDEIDVRARELGVSYWEAIDDLLADERRLSPRAGAALANFQKIVKGLAARAESTMSGATEGEGVDARGTSPTVREGSRTQTVESDSPVSDLVKAAILETGYENALKAENNDEAEARLENLQELVNAAVDYDEQGPEGLRDFIDHSALVADTDQYKSDVPVTLMTAHSAKGLEFPLVFIVGLEDGLFPHSRSLSDASDIEEERRLAYVAMTRAEKYLYVTHAVKRRVYGEELASEPSQFLNEMPLELIEDISRGRSWLSFARNSKALEQVAGSLQYEYDDSAPAASTRISGTGNSDRLSARRPGTKLPGKTYDSVESIEEFFRKRAAKMGGYGTPKANEQGKAATQERPASSSPAAGSGSRSAPNAERDVRAPANDIVPGSYVRHAKYGRGLVLRREGTGDQTKFTVSFPGYGQKKLIEKYANLEKG